MVDTWVTVSSASFVVDGTSDGPYSGVVQPGKAQSTSAVIAIPAITFARVASSVAVNCCVKRSLLMFMLTDSSNNAGWHGLKGTLQTAGPCARILVHVRQEAADTRTNRGFFTSED